MCGGSCRCRENDKRTEECKNRLKNKLAPIFTFTEDFVNWDNKTDAEGD